ncbi:hypothetical protein ACP70R_032636 [Stipagrostis hirtigluma subsp. patula]
MAKVELPLSGAKKAAEVAMSLVDKAYSLGGLADDRRQLLLQKLRSIHENLDRAEGQLISGSFVLNQAHDRMPRVLFRFWNAVDEIDDAIDEIDYHRFEASASNPISKFVERNVISKLGRFAIPKSNLKRLRKAIGRLADVMHESNFDLSRALSAAHNYERYPSWVAAGGGIFGRDREKEEIVRWLTKYEAEGDRLSVYGVVGMAGVGKTSLAYIVRQDPRVLASFHFVVWVPVSVDFSTDAMARLILESISSDSSRPPASSSTYVELSRALRYLKVLLILDDVWEDSNPVKWNTFVAPLQVCKEGSKILLTTRMKSVVDMAATATGASAECMILSDFDEDDRLMLLKSRNNFGRDREKEQIMQWLTKDIAEGDPVSVCAVVGMAGMGKTTLAKIVCHEPRVLANFNAVVWLPVSVDFNTEAMARVMLESITGKRTAYSSMYLLQNSLTDTLRYRKVLLILDDVWEDSNTDKWEALVAPLRVCKKGSRILLTTRMQSVVNMAATATGVAAECLKLDDLDEDDSLMLLKSRLPSQVDSEDYDNLMLIGEQIVKKIGGCPLVTSLVASWLGSHMETHHWNTVLQRGWQHIIEKGIIFESFRLSYYCLHTELQACFRYCSLFPKGYKFNKKELAKMWTGSGLIRFSSSKQENIGLQKTKYVDLSNAEDVGEEYFDALARKSFFCCMLETESSSGDQKEYFVLHDLLHDLAELVSRGECARVDGGDLSNVWEGIRHLSIADCCDLKVTSRYLEEASRNNSLNNEPHTRFQFLRSLIIEFSLGQNTESLDQNTELVLGEFLKGSTCLRLLYLGVSSMFHALDNISSLTHLRYLFLLSCHESHLHKVFKLYHLQVFKLEYFTAKEADCTEIYNLCCLHCLHVPDSISSNIRQIGRLTSLQEVHGFQAVENDGQRLKALGNLRSLYQLSLRNLQNVSNVKEAMEIKLKNKYHMKFLSLSWNRKLKVHQDDRIIDNLEPSKEIRGLHIHGYDGVKLPFWIEKSPLIHLVSLELEYCMKWKSLPSLQELNSLKHLKLENLFQLECIGTVLEQQLEASEADNAFLPPFLSTLIVRWCPNLKQLPAIPCTLERLIIKHVHLAVLPKIQQQYTDQRESTSVKSHLGLMQIESCARLTSLGEGLLEQQEQLHSLTTLVVRHCARLHHLPKGGFTGLHCLKSLEIVSCPILKDVKIGGGLLLTPLKNLELNPCGDIDVSILMSLQNMVTLRRLILFNCSNIEKLPSVEVFGTLGNLNNVSIARCKSLVSLGGLGAVASLRTLSILCCDKLSVSQSEQDCCSFKLQKLRTDHVALLLVEPLKSLRYTRELHICDDYAMESLPEEWLLQNAISLHSIEIGVAKSLRSLPSDIEKLRSLESLQIERAPLIQSLPQLPASLRKLRIRGCDPEFLKCYERDVGSDWGKIAHIASVDIKAYSEGMDYGDDRSQYFVSSTSNPYRHFVVID